MRTNRLESFVGIGLLVIVLLAFILQIILQLPKSSEVSAKAQVVPTIPRDLFATDNPLNKQIQQLSVPTNVPVSVQGSDVGRDNVFANF